MKNEIILVTGVGGFIGFHLARALLERGDVVIGIDNLSDYYDVSLKKERIKNLKKEPLAKNFTFVKADITNSKKMNSIFEKYLPRKVCHLAAQAGVRYSLENPFAYENTNNLGTLVLLEACRQHKVKHFIFASSSSVYGINQKMPFKESDKTESQISTYASTKKYNELLAHTYSHLFGIHCTGLRFFTVYGPWGRPDMALFKFTKSILNDRPIHLFNKGKHRRDFTFITDIIAGVLGAIDRSKKNRFEIFNLAKGESIELKRYVDALEKILGRRAKKIMLPLQKGDVVDTYADISKARRMLDYNPRVGFEEGVREFVKWYRQFYGV